MRGLSVEKSWRHDFPTAKLFIGVFWLNERNESDWPAVERWPIVQSCRGSPFLACWLRFLPIFWKERAINESIIGLFPVGDAGRWRSRSGLFSCLYTRLFCCFRLVLGDTQKGNVRSVSFGLSAIRFLSAFPPYAERRRRRRRRRRRISSCLWCGRSSEQSDSDSAIVDLMRLMQCAARYRHVNWSGSTVARVCIQLSALFIRMILFPMSSMMWAWKSNTWALEILTLDVHFYWLKIWTLRTDFISDLKSVMKA